MKDKPNNMTQDRKDLPPRYEDVAEGSSEQVLGQATFIFAGDSVVCETTAGTAPAYKLSWDVTAIPPKGTSVIFERVDPRLPEKVEGEALAEHQTEHLFYLAHPAGAQYQTDKPAYYITCSTAERGAALGNISLEATSKKAPFQRTEFRALLHAGRSADDSPLFADAASAEPLFDARPKWVGGRYVWADSGGAEVAQEEEKDGQHRLAVTTPMARGIRDALVATWCLRLWHNTAESKAAKRDGTFPRYFFCVDLSSAA